MLYVVCVCVCCSSLLLLPRRRLLWLHADEIDVNCVTLDGEEFSCFFIYGCPSMCAVECIDMFFVKQT